MWERFHIFLAEPRERPTLDPRPGSDISDRVFAFAVTGQVFARSARVLAAQLDFEHAVDAEGFIAEPFDGVCVSSIVGINILYFVMGRWGRRVLRIQDMVYAQGIFSLANLAK